MVINSNNIGDYIKEPSLVLGSLVNDFEKIKIKYPYCSTAYLLFLKSLSDSDNLHFEEHLKLTAAHVMDRKKMYQLIHNNSEIQDVSNNDKEETEENQPSSVIEDKILETDILSHAVEAAYEATPENIIIEEKVQDQPKETISNEINSEERVNTEQLTFIQWLKYKQTGTLEDEKETKDKGTSEGLEEKNIKHLKGKSDSFNSLSKLEINNLLDKFISEEPRISKPREEFYNPSKSAKKSLEESIDIISETLAKIHLMQKNYSKAISAYEQLILLYPEKKVFFADQIKKIKEEQNN